MTAHDQTGTAARPARAQSRARTAAVRALEAEFSGLVGQIQQLVAETATRIAPGMMPGEYKVFTAIVRAGSITATTLAEQLMMDKSQLSRTVHGLLDGGLIARSPNPADARVSVLSPTPDGLARLEAARHPHHHTLADALNDWEIADIHRLSELLHALSTGTTPQRG